MIIVTGGVGTTGKVLCVNDTQVSEFLSFPGNEVYGITKANGHYYVALRAGQPKVVMLDSNLKVLCHSRLPSIADPHCIFVENNIVHLVSSSEDLVYKFTLGLDFVGRDVFGLGGDNRFHVNDVARIGSEFFVSMFTDKADGKWNEDVGQGLIKSSGSISPTDMKTEFKELLKPHSPILFKDDLWVCDSGRGSVWCNNTKIFQRKHSWTRGLCVEDDFIHIGVARYTRDNNATLVTLTRSGDVVREVTLPLEYVYGIQRM